MKSFIRVFDVVLTTKGPVFIGSGQEIMKKEYIFLKNKRKVMIPQLDTMYSDICSLSQQNEFENYILSDSKMDLGAWVEQQHIPETYVNRWKQYELDCGDTIIKRGTPMQIMACVKDPYGNPYIPGSSLKGLLRTILLAYDIKCNQGRYSKVKEDIRQGLYKGERNRTRYLKNEARRAEEIAFHKLSRTEKKADRVNDIMTGIVVSDSRPLSTDDLVLCQKIEYHTDGTERRLNLLRECIKPDTKIHFELMIETDICDITEQDIKNAIQQFGDIYYKQFIKKFPQIDMPDNNTVWLGGGAGYVSKTVTYALFGEDAPQVVSTIFQNTGVPSRHQHNKDIQMGVSPHILKLTQYQGRRYQFGACNLQLTERI